MRGEFIRGDGLVLPNNVTTIGQLLILNAAMRAIHAPLAMILGSGVYAPDMTAASMNEPTQGGYVRQQLRQVQEDWTIINPLNGEWSVESKPCVFPAGAYNKSISRLAIVDQASSDLYMLSSPLPAPLLITPATPEADRTFRYRLYLR